MPTSDVANIDAIAEAIGGNFLQSLADIGADATAYGTASVYAERVASQIQSRIATVIKNGGTVTESTSSMVKILSTTDTVSREFRALGVGMFVFVPTHTGGTWKLQAEHPSMDGTWVDIDGPQGVEFASTGMVYWYGLSTVNYRLAGGTVGAEAWVSRAALVTVSE